VLGLKPPSSGQFVGRVIEEALVGGRVAWKYKMANMRLPE
jgi:hypothetical protein